MYTSNRLETRPNQTRSTSKVARTTSGRSGLTSAAGSLTFLSSMTLPPNASSLSGPSMTCFGGNLMHSRPAPAGTERSVPSSTTRAIRALEILRLMRSF